MAILTRDKQYKHALDEPRDGSGRQPTLWVWVMLGLVIVAVAVAIGATPVAQLRTVPEDPPVPPAIPAEHADSMQLDYWIRQDLSTQPGATEAGASPEAAEDWARLDYWHRQWLLTLPSGAEAGASPEAAGDWARLDYWHRQYLLT
jgi:hypothetical protein